MRVTVAPSGAAAPLSKMHHTKKTGATPESAAMDIALGLISAT
jgi:hypothetical protein